MDMKLNARWIRSERERRAMSQEQLASAAGLGTRTVQRVEKTGLASFETTKAIASVFETSVEQLTTQRATPPWLSLRNGALAASAALALVAALVWTRPVHAAQLLLDVGLSMNEQKMSDSELITQNGKEAEIRIDNLIKAIIAPTLRSNGTVSMELRLYEFDGTDFVLSSSPTLLVHDNSTAEITLTGNTGRRFELRITPHQLHE